MNNITVDQIYNDMRTDLRALLQVPFGEILIYPFTIKHDSLKLLDKNNILKKADYPDLYKVIGDYWTNYYKEFIKSTYEIPLADPETEFMLPNLSGRYLVQRERDGNFELTSAELQGFNIHIDHQFAKVSLINTEKNLYKGNSELSINVNTTNTPIKQIELLTQFDESHLTDSEKKINIADKCVLFYMRVK